MFLTQGTDIPEGVAPRRSEVNRFIVPGVQVIREGKVEPFLGSHPKLSSSTVHWGGVALDKSRLRTLASSL